MSSIAKGVLATVIACVFWGASGVFYSLLSHLSLFEIMAHRTVWTFVIFALLLWSAGKARAPLQALTTGRSFWLIFWATLMVGLNWLIFVFAIQIDRALEASLGYFLFPIMAVVLGRLVFAERLGTAQSLAVALAAFAVAVLTAGLGVAPWIALMLALTFGLYGVFKKRLEVDAVTSVTAEAMLLLPPSLAWLVVLHSRGQGAFGQSVSDSLLLILSGPMVAAPLILFSYAATRISMASLGVLSYLNPSLQFLAATLILKEPFGLWHALAFAMIWVALALYAGAALRQDKAARSATVRSATSETERM